MKPELETLNELFGRSERVIIMALHWPTRQLHHLKWNGNWKDKWEVDKREWHFMGSFDGSRKEFKSEDN